MSDDRHRETQDERSPSPEQQAARAAVRALDTPVASAAFRTRMREAFVTGDFGVGTSTGEASDNRVSTPRASAITRLRRPRVLIGLAAAAMVLAAIGLANRGEGWTITDVGSNATIVLNGREVSCADLSPLQASLRAGCRLVIPEGGRMELLNPNAFLLELGGGVEFTLPRAPGRWFAREVHSQVEGRGTVRVATAEGFTGATYRLRTSSTELTVTGTAFTVIQSEDSVCLCVLEGEVTATLPDGSIESIGAGRRVFVSPGEGMVDHGPMLEQEREALLELRARASGFDASR